MSRTLILIGFAILFVSLICFTLITDNKLFAVNVVSDWAELIAIILAFLGLSFAYKQLSKADEQSATQIQVLENQTKILRDIQIQSSEAFTTLVADIVKNQEAEVVSSNLAARAREIEIKPSFQKPNQGFVSTSGSDGWEFHLLNVGGKAKDIQIIRADNEGNESAIIHEIPSSVVNTGDRLIVKGRSTNPKVPHSQVRTIFYIKFKDVDGNQYQQRVSLEHGVSNFYYFSLGEVEMIR